VIIFTTGQSFYKALPPGNLVAFQLREKKKTGKKCEESLDDGWNTEVENPICNTQIMRK